MNLTTLADKAVLVKLSQSSLGTTKRESQLTDELREQKSDKGLIVLSKLFADKNNPVNDVLKMVSELYQYHRTKTLPYQDGGERLCPNNVFMDYSAGIATRRQALTQWGNDHLDKYDQYIQSDIAYRASMGKPRVTPDDYPTVDRLESVLNPKVIVTPVPSVNHFSPVIDLSDDDKANFESVMAQRYASAQDDAVKRITEPLTKLIKKLEVYSGAQDERFHSSLVSNVVEGAMQAKDLTLEGSQDYFDSLDELSKFTNSVSVDAIRENEHYRSNVKTELEKVMDKMSMFAPK